MVIIWTLAIVYYIVVIAIGVWANRLVKSSSDYLIGGRDVSWVLQGVGLSAMLVAGTTVATQGSIGYTTGLAAHWWVTTWCLAVLFGAFAFSRFFRRTGAYTLTEWFGGFFQDPKVKRVASIVLTLGCYFSPLANILGGAVIIAGLMNISVPFAIVIMGLAVAIYLYFGGLWAALMTDFAQWVMATAFFIIVVPIFLIKNSDASLWQSLPSSYFSLGTGGTLKPISWALPSIFGMFWTNFCLTSGGFYWNKSSSSRNIKDARKAWIFGVLISVPYMFSVPCIGMFVKGSGVVLEVPDMALGHFLSMMPSGLAAFGLIAILAATMSTAVSGVLAGSTVIIRDIVKVKYKDEKAEVNASRLITLAFALSSILGAMVFNKIMPVLGSAFALALLSGFVSVLIPPFLGTMLWKKSKKEGALLAIVIPTIITLATVLFTDLWRSYHPQFTGFIMSTVIFVVVSLIVDKTGPWWKSKEYKPEEDEKAEVEINVTTDETEEAKPQVSEEKFAEYRKTIITCMKPYWGLHKLTQKLEKAPKGRLAKMFNL